MYKIAICIKAVKTSLVYQNEKRNETLVINPYDLNIINKVVTAARNSKCNITCICMGAKSSEETLRRCLALGVDEVYLVNDIKYAGADTIATVNVLAAALKKTGTYDLIICGKKAVDGETGQVSYGLAQKLNLSFIDNVVDIGQFNQECIDIILKKEDALASAKAFYHTIFIFDEYSLKEENLSLMSLKKAKNREINIITNEDLKLADSICGSKGSKTYVMETKASCVKKVRNTIHGNCKEKADFICEYLIKRGT